MIQKLRNGRGAVARFGRGTVMIRQYVLVGRPGGQIELTTCEQTKIGLDPLESKSGTNKIVLDFHNVQSLDVLIDRLEMLRERMSEKS